jgi:hypothetical protein
MKLEKTIEFVKKAQDLFPDCKITITTDDPDESKNLENAKAFGKAGVRGRWRKKK